MALLVPPPSFWGAQVQPPLPFCASPQHTSLMSPSPGKELYEFHKGDVYVAEMLYTKGHTAEVTGCQFSPNDPKLILTGGKDSTLRLWDLDRVQYRCKEVIKTAQGM